MEFNFLVLGTWSCFDPVFDISQELSYYFLLIILRCNYAYHKQVDTFQCEKEKSHYHFT